MPTNKSELHITIDSNLKNLSEISQKLNLNPKQRERYSKAEASAMANVAAGDWNQFKKNFEVMVNILKKVAAGSGQISKDLEELNNEREKLEKEINKLKNEKVERLGSKLKDNKISKNEAKDYYAQNAKDIRSATGKSLGRETALERIEKLEASLGGNRFSSVTNAQARVYGFQDITSARNARNYFKSESKYEQQLIDESEQYDRQIAEKEGQLPQLISSIGQLEKASEQGAEGIQALYNKIMELNNVTLNSVSGAQRQERQDKKEAEGGGAAETKQDTPKTLDKTSSSLGRAFKQFTLYAIALRFVRRAAREAIATIKQLDKSLTEQAMVTGKTRKQTYELLSSYQELASQLGATTKEVAEVATQFLRQGKSTEESLKLTNAAIAAAKVAGIQATESVNYLTTALNGFQLAAEDAMRVSDKFAAVAANAAVSYDEIAIALSKVAAQANLAGMSIDYTTALLAKGIETTREAPETIGTALKTVIARMREMGDYGETLAGDTDVNNVETQLAYVGIQLKNNNGELRSTEEVLNDLGLKWNTLNTNQQAAIAKALAGTRQQSRLIAMMTDYERTIELQEIANRSAGATMAQMATYMEGMDAALNRVNIAWEKLISSLTNSDAITTVINMAASAIDFIADNLWTLIPVGVALLAYATKTINLKLREAELSKINLKLAQQKAIADNKEQQTAAHKVVLEKELTLEGKKQLLDKKRKEDASDAEIAQLEAEVATAEKELNIAKDRETYFQKEGYYLEAQQSTLMDLDNAWTGLGGTIKSFFMSIIPGLSQVITKVRAYKAASKEQADQAQRDGQKNAANSGAMVPMIGWIIWAAIMGAGILSTIYSAITKGTGLVKSGAEKVEELSANIYKLNNEASAIDNITSSFDKLNNKLVKTNDDLKEMNDLLDAAADKLSDEDIKKNKDIGFGKGMSAKDYYETFTTTEGRRSALSYIAEVDRKRIKEAYQEQLKTLNQDTSWLLGTSTGDATMREAVRKVNNAFMYETIDALKQEGKLSSEAAIAVETLSQKLLEDMDIQKAFALNADGTGGQIAEFTRRIANATYTINGQSYSIAEILGNKDYTLREQVESFKAAKDYLGEFSEEYQALVTSYKEFSYFSQINADILDFMESVNMTTDELNEFYASWQNLQKSGWNISQKEWENNFEGVLQLLTDTNGDINQVIQTYYSSQVAQLRQLYDKDEDFYKAYDALINAFANAVEVGTLNMGQNLDKFSNSINNFYEKASKWMEMSENDKTQFMSDYSAFFGGTDGGELLAAFKSGNYNAIETALKNSAELQKELHSRLAEIEQDLLIEEARIGSERNEAYIAYLKEWRQKLLDTTTLFRADLQTLINQEKAQLDIYKEYLEAQQKELEDSLNKRKEAYEKYFEAINQEYEEEEYEKQANTLMTNLSKISTSTDAASQAQRKQLEQQLKDLEEERQKTLRENAQQVVLNNMESTLEEISEKFDKLLNSNQALIDAMKGEIANNGEGFLTSILSSALKDGKLTNYEAENFINELQTAFSSSMSGIDWDSLSARTENNQLILHINGQEVYVDSSNSETLYQEILAALIKAGYGK